jgi:hypothetical protein
MESIETHLSKKLINLLQKLHLTTLIITPKAIIRNKIKTSAHRSRLAIIAHPKISITQIINDVVTFQKEIIRKINTIEAIAIIERIVPWKISSKYRTSILQLRQNGKR